MLCMASFVDTLQVLAEPRRHAIIELLSGGEQCLCDISAALEVSDQLASHHVKRLRDAGIVRTSRRGLWLYCRLDPQVVEDIADGLSMLAVRARESAAGSDAGAEPCCPGTECRPDGGR